MDATCSKSHVAIVSHIHVATCTSMADTGVMAESEKAMAITKIMG